MRVTTDDKANTIDFGRGRYPDLSLVAEHYDMFNTLIF